MSKFRLPPLPSISEIIRLYKLSARKQLSQNFILDKNILDKIVRSAGNIENKYLIEIGSGPGGLTRSCIQAGVSGMALVEKDLRFMEGLQMLIDSVEDKIPIKIYQGDVLKIDLKTLIPPEYAVKDWENDEAKVHILGNLPFSISLPLLFKLLKEISERSGPFSFGRVPLTLMFQYEVGQRMVSPPSFNQRSRVSITCQYLCDVKFKMIVPDTVFVPKPKVSAAVMKLVPLKKPLINHDFDTVTLVTRSVFQFKNKSWLVGFKTLFPIENKNDISEEIKDLCNIEMEKTAGDLTVEEIGQLCDIYKQKFKEYKDKSDTIRKKIFNYE